MQELPKLLSDFIPIPTLSRIVLKTTNLGKPLTIMRLFVSFGVDIINLIQNVVVYLMCKIQQCEQHIPKTYSEIFFAGKHPVFYAKVCINIFLIVSYFFLSARFMSQIVF